MTDRLTDPSPTDDPHTTPPAPPSTDGPEGRDTALLDDPRLTTMGLLMEVHSGLRAASDPDLEAHGLTNSDFDVLIRLARSPERRLHMTALAGQSTLSNSGLTRVVDRLLASGLVERVRDDRDRRVYFAVLTDAGLDRVLGALPTHLALLERTIVAVLPPSERAALERALRKIRSVVKPDADPDGPARPGGAPAERP